MVVVGENEQAGEKDDDDENDDGRGGYWDGTGRENNCDNANPRRRDFPPRINTPPPANKNTEWW